MSSFFFDMPAELMSALATVLGFAFMDEMTSYQQNSLGNFLMLVAQVMITNATQKQLLETQNLGAAQASHETRLQRLEEIIFNTNFPQNGNHSSSVD